MSPEPKAITTTDPLPSTSSVKLVFGPPHTHHVEHVETDPDVLAKLEWLDDLMFEAIEGDAVALETAIDAWKKSLDELGPEPLEESRTQYLRRAQSVWNELRLKPNHPPHKVFAAIEIISLLAAKAW
jgi:hypothetical protein